MNAIKEAIQALTQAEWKELYQWALLEERQRREREAVKDELINEILGRDKETAEEVPAEEEPVPEEEPVDDSTKS